MTATPLDPDLLDRSNRYQRLTAEYARYATNAAGLGIVAGGALALAAYIAHGWAPLSGWGRALLALSPVVWIVVKELLRRRLYQRYGRVRPAAERGEERWHRFRTLFVAGVSVLVLVTVAPRLWSEPARLWPTLLYLTFVAALPALVWWFMRSSEEFIIGVFLVCQAAVASGGGHYAPSAANAVFLLAAAVGIGVGLSQHRAFRRLERELAALRGPAAAPGPQRAG